MVLPLTAAGTKRETNANKGLDSDEVVVSSHYSWTPLDYYVTGHVISHSNCPWRLYWYCFHSSIDDEMFELLCQGCATPGGAGCEGYISYANFRGNDITSTSNTLQHNTSLTQLCIRMTQSGKMGLINSRTASSTTKR